MQWKKPLVSALVYMLTYSFILCQQVSRLTKYNSFPGKGSTQNSAELDFELAALMFI